jgi:hypothetical protein
VIPLKFSSQAVATIFSNASLFPTEAGQHQTLRMPAIAIGTSDDNRSARRLRIASALIPLISTKWAECFMAAFLGDQAWNCEMYVPPSNSKITVNSAMSLIVAA